MSGLDDMVRSLAVAVAVAIAFVGLAVAPAEVAALDAGATGPIVVTAPPPAAPTVTATLSAREVGLGRPFYVFIEVTCEPGVRINLPAALDLGHGIEELRRTSSASAGAGTTVTHSFEIEVIAFELGALVVQPVPIVYVVDGHSAEIASPPLDVAVAGVVGEGEPRLRDIAPPVPVRAPNWPLVYAALIAAGAFVLAIAWWGWRRRARRLARRRGRRGVAPIVLPPGEQALARMSELEASGLLDASDRKQAFHELSEIVRGYLGRRYDFAALDLTTAEIAAHLATIDDGAEVSELLGDWLERCDLVKFAGADASADEARRALYEARRFVEATRPQPAAAARTVEAGVA